MRTEFVVKVSAACMPSSCWGRYVRVAVLEVEAGARPRMISERARGVVRIVRVWSPCHVGKTRRSASAVAIREAEELAQELNNAR